MCKYYTVVFYLFVVVIIIFIIVDEMRRQRQTTSAVVLDTLCSETIIAIHTRNIARVSHTRGNEGQWCVLLCLRALSRRRNKCVFLLAETRSNDLVRYSDPIRRVGGLRRNGYRFPRWKNRIFWNDQCLFKIGSYERISKINLKKIIIKSEYFGQLFSISDHWVSLH